MDDTGNSLHFSGDKQPKLDKTIFTVACHPTSYSNETQYFLNRSVEQSYPMVYFKAPLLSEWTCNSFNYDKPCKSVLFAAL